MHVRKTMQGTICARNLLGIFTPEKYGAILYPKYGDIYAREVWDRLYPKCGEHLRPRIMGPYVLKCGVHLRPRGMR